MVRRPGFLSFVAPGSQSPLQSPLGCGRFGSMDDRANRAFARPPIGSVNVRRILDDVAAFIAVASALIVATFGLCAVVVIAIVMHCPVR